MSDYPPDQPSPQDPLQPYPQAPGDPAYAVVWPPVEQPRSIRTAVLLMRAGAGLSAIYLVATLAFIGSLKDEIRTQLENSNADYTQSQLDTAFTAYFVSVVVFGLIGVGLWLWMAAANGKGKNWARTTATVLGAFNIMLSLLALVGGNGTPLSWLFTVLNLGIAIGALWYLYRPDASRYYALRSRR